MINSTLISKTFPFSMEASDGGVTEQMIEIRDALIDGYVRVSVPLRGCSFASGMRESALRVARIEAPALESQRPSSCSFYDDSERSHESTGLEALDRQTRERERDRERERKKRNQNVFNQQK